MHGEEFSLGTALNNQALKIAPILMMPCEPNGLIDLTVKRNKTKQIRSNEHSYQVNNCETMLIELDHKTPCELLDNV